MHPTTATSKPANEDETAQGYRIVTGEDFDEKAVVLADNLSLSTDADLAVALAQDVQGDLAQQHRVFNCLVDAYATGFPLPLIKPA